MHIAINGRFFSQPITGVQRYARELVAAMDNEIANWANCTAELLVPKAAAGIPVFNNIAVRRVGRLKGHAWEQLELPIHQRGDVLFCPSNTAPVASVMNGKAIVTVHDLSYLYHPEAYSRAFRYFYNLLMPVILSRAEMITVSTAEFTKITHYYPHAAARLSVIPNGGVPSSMTLSSTSPGPESLQPYVLYVGSFTRRKNFHAVVQTARRLLENHPYMNFVFVGSSPKIFTQGDDMAFEPHPRMIFTGQINDFETLAPYYRSAQAILFPSFYESSGLPPVEAMANGCPVIASNIPALIERCGDAAVYCDPHDADSIYDATLRVITDPELRASLVQKGLERSKLFTWETCAQTTLQCISRSKALGAAQTADAMRRFA